MRFLSGILLNIWKIEIAFSNFAGNFFAHIILNRYYL